MKKIIFAIGLALSTLVATAAPQTFYSLLGSTNTAVNLTAGTTVTNGTVGYTYTNNLGNAVVAGQYAITNLFTNGSVIYTNYGPYQAGVFQTWSGIALSTGEPNNNATLSITVQGKEVGDTNTTVVTLKKTVDGSTFATAGGAFSFAVTVQNMGTSNVCYVTNLPSAFVQGASGIAVDTIAPGSATGATNLVLNEIGIISANR